ncbi:MAG: MFS transporter [Elusimicrobia bacterium]|nr:MFS transporter [Elusimicrobiota bacterium]
MNPFSRLGVKVVAFLLAYLLSVQSALAAVQSVQVRTGALPVGTAGAVGSAFQGAKLGPAALMLSGVSVQSLAGPSLSNVPAVSAAAGIRAAAPVAAPAAALAAPAVSAQSVPAAQAAAAPVEEKVQLAAQAADEAVREVEKASSDGSKAAVEKQFSALTGERLATASSDSVDPVPAAETSPAKGPSLESPAQGSGEAKAEAGGSGSSAGPGRTEVLTAGVPAAKGGFGRGFKDPERNKSFWRYVFGNIIYTFGIEMYTVGLPYLVSSFTKNSLRENNDPRAGNAEAVQALVRENRSLARIAHWTAQAFSYVSIPLFTRNSDGSLKWLPRSFWIRSAVLGGIVGVFFASGLLSVTGALYALAGFIAVQSFFQGLSVTMESVGLNRMLGDKSVTDKERVRANAILTFAYSAVAIIGPAIAGQISMVGDFMGKTGVGSAVIYGLYALSAGIAGLIYATVRIFKQKESDPAAQASGAKEKTGLGGVLKELGTSLKDGVRMIFKDRFLRIYTIATLLVSLFSDPLIFNVLPEYVENLIAANPATIGAALKIPVLGWFLKGMTSTPMGFFSLLVVFSSIGSILGSLLVDPVRKLLDRLGFKSEESMSVPLFALAALQIPLFWLMISVPSMWLVLPLYGLQTFLGSFALMIISGIHQKKMGTYTGKKVGQMLAAESFLGIIAAIISTYVYGFVLNGIPIATALLFAAVATTVYGIFQLVLPWLAFSKEQRRRDRGPAK